jgi:hypothetical protein
MGNLCTCARDVDVMSTSMAIMSAADQQRAAVASVPPAPPPPASAVDWDVMTFEDY